MSVFRRSGLVHKRTAFYQLLYDQVKSVDLKPVSRIEYKFDPFAQNTKEIRNFMFFLSGPQIRDSNIKCTFKTEVVCDHSEPTVVCKLKMDLEKPIFCLEHCKGKRIFGFGIPQCCPFCRTDLNECSLRIPPFRLPTPFRDAQKSPCSIVLKPTKGDFLTDYKNSDSLHIGVTTSTGIVFEFDSDGLKSGKTAGWNRCLAIREFNKDKDLPSWGQYWDFTLQAISGQELWTKDRYNETTHSCYTFVLAFLRALQSPELSVFARDRRMFCERYILPKTASAAKYITLYRKLMAEGKS